MKNKMELLQAAQTNAADTLAIKSEFDLLNAKVAGFKELAISGANYPDYSAYFDSSRAAYVSTSQVPIAAE